MKHLFLTLTLILSTALAFAGGKKEALHISILGDSYSTYEGYLTPDTNAIWYFKPDNKELNSRNDVRQVEETWWHQVIKNMGGVLERNNSYSGSTICYTGYMDKKTGKHQDYSDRAFITRSNKLGEPDVILVCGGTNDSWAGAPIGDYVYGNWSNKELYSFRPAMAKLLYDLRLNYPTARIVFILNSELKADINESVHTICRHYGIDCLDLKDINKQMGHPSIAGMKAIAEQVTEYLKGGSKKYHR